MRERGLAQRCDLARFEKTQNLRLEIETHLANLVEEQRAADRGADEARVVAIGACERPPSVAEQLAFEHVTRHGGAVEGDEWLGRPRGVAVNRAREHFFARPAFAGNQHADVGAGDALGQCDEVAHLPVDDRVPGFERDVVNRPERDVLFVFLPGAFDVVDRGQDEANGLKRRTGFDVWCRDDEQFDGALVGRANDEASRRDVGWGRSRGVGIGGGEDVGGRLGSGHGGRGVCALGVGNEADEFTSEEFRASCIEEQGGSGLQHGLGVRVDRSFLRNSVLRLSLPGGPCHVPCAGKFLQARYMTNTLVHSRGPIIVRLRGGPPASRSDNTSNYSCMLGLYVGWKTANHVDDIVHDGQCPNRLTHVRKCGRFLKQCGVSEQSIRHRVGY